MPDTSAPDAAPEAPALWRPSAVAVWSLLFTPVFGSLLLMHAWHVLGPAHAVRPARHWLLASMLVLLLELLAGAINERVNGNTPLAQLIGLAGWGCGCWPPRRRSGGWCGAASAGAMPSAPGVARWAWRWCAASRAGRRDSC